MITAAPNIGHLRARQGASADPGSTSCDMWLSMESSCTAATPDFLSMAFTQEASCLCYSGTAWQPSVFDNAFQTCLSHLYTASPSQWSALGGTSLITTPCAKAGNVVATPPPANGNTTTYASSVPSAAVVGNSAACNSWNSMELACANTISSFTALSFSVEASCLCYSSSTYLPFIYDGYLKTCLAYLSTADPTFYASLGGDQLPRTPCAEVGNVAAGPTAPTPTAGGTTTHSASSPPSVTSSIASATSSLNLTTTVATTVSSSGAAATFLRSPCAIVATIMAILLQLAIL